MTSAKRYTVMVDENSHYQDPDSRYTKGTYSTVEEALTECRRMVDADLAGLRQPGMSAKALITAYQLDGRDPFVVSPKGAEKVDFSAWDYAEQRAAVLCGG